MLIQVNDLENISQYTAHSVWRFQYVVQERRKKLSGSQTTISSDTTSSGDMKDEQPRIDSPQRTQRYSPPTPLAKKLADIMPQILPGTLVKIVEESGNGMKRSILNAL